ncbi:flagellar protein FliT [Clostridium sp. ATCC 25772]|uniref:flagellar protein FliT n=1 Tax=Clostridium sp. ATCC 25772 TaxID=1676991 RepID=UPI0007822BCC|nr:flagellar protein FliT [Clostridium sp. ATCC 25772]
MENLLERCSSINQEIIRSLSEDIENASYDNIESLIIEKQMIINKIENSNVDKERLKSVICKLNLLEDEKKIKILFNTRKDEIKDKIKIISRNKVANNQYNKDFYRNSYFINEKV